MANISSKNVGRIKIITASFADIFFNVYLFIFISANQNLLFDITVLLFLIEIKRSFKVILLNTIAHVRYNTST